MSFEEYKVEDGEPSGIQKKIWNGELMEYQRSLLVKLYKSKDKEVINKTIKELIKTTYHVQDELRKASFYKGEFDAFASFLSSFDALSVTKITEETIDDHGKKQIYVIDEKRSIVKSIPTVRALIQG